MATDLGAAEVRIELLGGNITVYHGTDGTVLAKLENAPEGTWRKLWECFATLGIKPCP